MKKIFYISISIFIILAIIVVLHKSKDKTFKIDDAIFAVSLDGTLINNFPDKGGYHINIKCENAIGTWDVDSWQLELKNISGDVECNLDFVTITTSNILEFAINNIVAKDDEVINNNGYRYVGSNPNNYVWFNNELWRIIGSIPTKKNNSVEKDLVKIIRNDSLSVINFHYEDWANTFWDNVVTPDHSYTFWKNTSLWKVLNENYYGKKDATSKKYNDDGFLGINLSSEICRLYKRPYSTYGKCDYVNNGIDSSVDSYYGKMIQEVYWNIGKISDNNPNGTYYTFTCNGETSQTVTSKIGLASCSDYNKIYRANNNNNLNYVNWMSVKGIQYLISPYSNTEVFYVSENGTIQHTYVYNPMNVIPALYLNENVYVVSGDGTINNPYKIAM